MSVRLRPHSDDKIFEELIMTLRSNSFVAEPAYLSNVKVTSLRKIMMIGSCALTPLEKKATFSYEWKNIDGIDYVTKVMYYAPGQDYVSRIYDLNPQTYIRLSKWYAMMHPVFDYPQFYEDAVERKRVQDVVKRFEEAAIQHGQRKAAVANGFISNVESYLRESGKILKTAREALYEELF